MIFPATNTGGPLPVFLPPATPPAAHIDKIEKVPRVGSLDYYDKVVPIEELTNGCDWCQGGACDLVYTRPGIPFKVYADIDEDDGMLCVHINDTIVASRRMNYCPMCGRRVG